mmetsp:Transcript_12934/g.23986  ORF Transcript_12934/g.23986 Transcript_12934/m.23986 type:complete len:366 (-) Transcript_12934:290-1387(-)
MSAKMDEAIGSVQAMMKVVNAKYKVPENVYNALEHSVVEKLKDCARLRKDEDVEEIMEPLDRQLVQTVEEKKSVLESMQTDLEVKRKAVQDAITASLEKEWNAQDQKKIPETDNSVSLTDLASFQVEKIDPASVAKLKDLLATQQYLIREVAKSVPEAEQKLRDAIGAVQSGVVTSSSEIDQAMSSGSSATRSPSPTAERSSSPMVDEESATLSPALQLAANVARRLQGKRPIVPAPQEPSLNAPEAARARAVAQETVQPNEPIQPEKPLVATNPSPAEAQNPSLQPDAQPAPLKPFNDLDSNAPSTPRNTSNKKRRRPSVKKSASKLKTPFNVVVQNEKAMKTIGSPQTVNQQSQAQTPKGLRV